MSIPQLDAPKTMKKLFLTALVVVAVLAVSCKKEPTGSISVDNATISTTDTATVTLTALENYSCVQWAMIINSDNAVGTIVSGGNAGDLEAKIIFPQAGTYQIDATAKNCKGSDYDGGDACVCEKNHTSETFSVTITVQ